MKKELEQVLNDIEQFKTVDHVTLVGVSKTRTVEEIKKLVALGINNLGENRPQELRDKYDEVDNVNWHMIGRLQSNKIKYVINRACLIHSIADIELLSKVNDAAIKNDKIMEVLLQVNTSAEASKQGFDEDELEGALKQAQMMSNVSVVGLMCMAPLAEGDDVVDKTFANAKRLYDTYRTENFKYLSMGMSTDYKIALKNGANLLRIGSMLFTED